ncbi:MAG: elongation factor P [Alkalispirochaetaceae bacterium]
MVKAGQIEKGMVIMFKDQPYLVAEREFVNPGKGSAFTRCKLKSLVSGQVLRETIKTNESVEEANVFHKQGQFLYSDGATYHFMDSETYEQFEVPVEGLEEKGRFMLEGESYEVLMWENKPIDINIPLKMVLSVTEAAEAVRGDTATGVTKTVTVETGVQVKVPIFIKEGDKILVNTESGEYVERVNQ